MTLQLSLATLRAVEAAARQRSYVLGVVPRLVFLRGDAVQWNPGDDWCVAGEVLTAPPEPTGTGWAISGR